MFGVMGWKLWPSMFDKQLLITGQQLTANHIAAGQLLLQRMYPDQCGLQDTCLLSENKWLDVAEDFVQVVHIEPDHWACLTNKFVASECSSHTVNLYDSLHTVPDKEGTIVKQACLILQTPESIVTINVINVQRQAGSVDCGLFALAMATDLCRDLDPISVSYHQHKIRSHLEECYEKLVMSPFPQQLHVRNLAL